MKVIEFPEVNVRIAEKQPEYETLPVRIDANDPEMPTIMCIQLNKKEIAQVKETGRIWLTVLTFGQPFYPIMLSLMRPENCTEPEQPERRYYFFNDKKERVFYCTKNKRIKNKSPFRLRGEFIGVKTQQEVSQSNYDQGIYPGMVVSLINGEKILVKSVKS